MCFNLCHLVRFSGLLSLINLAYLIELQSSFHYVKKRCWCSAVFFLSFVKLNPSEALYVSANESHACLSVECIQCMATLDNVVHVGLSLN
jgi:mannose-6-phosphate isomerase class I